MEKFTLYQKYQMVVHKDKKEDLTRDGFTRFLVDTPIIRTDPATGDVPNKQADVGEVYWGSYHQEYRRTCLTWASIMIAGICVDQLF